MMDTKTEVEQALELIDCQQVDELIKDEIAGLLEQIRSRPPYGHLHGKSISSWVKNRLIEYRVLHATGTSTPEHITGLFHFWSWDVDKYGPQPALDFAPKLSSSKLRRIVETSSTPIDRVAHRTAGE